jgi:hypothetical protein
MKAVIKFLLPIWSSIENKGTFCYKRIDGDENSNSRVSNLLRQKATPIIVDCFMVHK